MFLSSAFAQVLTAHIQLLFYLPKRIAREENPARVGQRLKPRCNVDPVALDFLTIDDHIADMDAHAKEHLLGLRQVRVALAQALQ